ncbi:MAG: phosphatase PAP2 family protein [Promethearchaeota archaeon]|nr:MAG: phosphatase PAP2 family protein [Candidatus Lokiarchaeota archaeon]
MSEKKQYLSKRALLIIGITSLAILIIGITLYFTDFNEAFYGESSTVRAIFKVITYLGEPVTYMIIGAILYLGYNKNLAKRSVVILLFSQYLNQTLKGIFQDTRPATNVGVEYGFAEPQYGFPSGHTQNSFSVYEYLSNEFKDEYKYKQVPIVPIILSGIVFLIAISRMIIGVHDLQDVVGGFLIGVGILLLYIYLEPFLSEQFNKLNLIVKLIFTVIISILLFLIGTLLFPNAGLGLVPGPLLYRDAGAFAQVGGALLGFGVGYLLEQEYVKYNPSQLTNKKKVINIVLAIVILMVAYLPFEYLIKIDSVIYRFARYALATFILGYVVPLICTKIS